MRGSVFASLMSWATMIFLLLIAIPGRSADAGGKFSGMRPTQTPPSGSFSGVSPATRPGVVAVVVPAGTEKAKLAVGTISVDTQLGRSAGTGFVVEMGVAPCFITNQHVVAGAKTLSVVMYNGRRLKLNLKEAEASPTQDLIRIPISPADLMGLDSLKRGGLPQVGTEVYALGNASGYKTLEVLPGSVVRIGGQDVEVTCKIVPGCSGGPIVDGNGKLVGVSTYLRVIKKSEDGTGQGGGAASPFENQENGPAAKHGSNGPATGGDKTADEIRRYGMVISDGTEWTIRGEDFMKQSMLLYDINTVCEHIAAYLECPINNAAMWIEDYKFNKRFEQISDPELRAGVVSFFRNDEQTNRVRLHLMTQHRMNGTMESNNAKADVQAMIGYRKTAINGMVGMSNVARTRHKAMAWTSDYLKGESENAMQGLSLIRATLNSSYNELTEIEQQIRQGQ